MEILIFVLLFIPAIVYQNFMHELSHVIVAKIHNKCKAIIIPLWHWVNVNDEDEYRIWRPWELFKKPYRKSRWLFARCIFESDKPLVFESLFYIAPLISATCLLSLVYIPCYIYAHNYFAVLLIVAAVDVLNWVFTYLFGTKYSDGTKYRILTD